MSNALETKVQRAIDLGKVAARIMKEAVHKADDDAKEQAIITEYAAVNVDFSVTVFTLVKKIWNVKKLWNVFSLLSLVKDELADPFKDEREAYKAFCRKWLPASGLELTDYELELIT